MIAVTPQSSVGPSELEADPPDKPTRNTKMPRSAALDGQP